MKRRSDGRNKGLKISEQKELEVKIIELVGQSCTDEEILLKLNLQPHVLRTYKERIADKQVYQLKKMGPQGILEDFARKSQENIKVLEDLANEMAKQKRTQTAMVQAIRLRNQIVRDVIRLARDLGLVTKRSHSVTANGTMFCSPTKNPFNPG